MHLTLRVGKRYATSVLVLLLLGTGFASSAVCQNTAQFSSYSADKRYDFNLTALDLARTPAWDDDQPNPPLPARSAMSTGRDYLRKLFADADKWELTNVTLKRVRDRWVYQVEFIEPPPEGCKDCLSFPFRVVVLMDGTAVPATISDWKPYQPH